MHAIPAMAIQPSSSSASAIERAASLHFWLFIAYIGVLVLAAVLTWLVWHSGNKLQDAIRADSEANIAAARRDAALANEGLAKSNEEIERAKLSAAEAGRRAAEANTKAEGFRLDIAKANESSAKAEARAAEANLELAKLRDPRTLTPEQQDRIIAALKNFAGQKFSFSLYPDPESMAFLRIIDALLKSAAWERVPSQIGDIVVEAAGLTAGTAYDSGVGALIANDDEASKPAVIALASALTREGVPCAPHTNPELIGKTPKAILINVGKKP
jgi:hypothetical protein